MNKYVRVVYWDFTKRYEAFLESLRHIVPTHIVYHAITEHPDPCQHRNKGCATLVDGIVHVYLLPSMPTTLAEETACHEIAHWELVGAGYDVWVRPRPSVALDVHWLGLCHSMSNTFADLVVDRRLTRLGYDHKEFRECILSDTTEALRARGNEVNSYPTQCVNALGVCTCAFTLSRTQWKEIKEVYKQKAPDEFRLGIEVIRRVPNGGLLTPLEYRELLKSLIRLFKIDHDVYLSHILTGHEIG